MTAFTETCPRSVPHICDGVGHSDKSDTDKGVSDSRMLVVVQQGADMFSFLRNWENGGGEKQRIFHDIMGFIIQ